MSSLPLLARTCFERGLAHFQKNELAPALAAFNEAVRLEPENVKHLRFRGRAQVRLKQFAGAIADFTRIIELNPDDAAAYNERAIALCGTGEFDRAAGDFSVVLKHKSDDAAAYFNRGCAFLNGNDPARAIGDFDEAIHRDPNPGRFYYFRGLARLRDRQWEYARSDFQSALDREPDNFQFLNQLAWLFCTCPEAGVRSVERAKSLAERANELASGLDPSILDTLAAACAEGGDFARASVWMEKAIAIAPPALLPIFHRHADAFRDSRPWRET